MYCQKCGSEIDDKATFCIKCGETIVKSKQKKQINPKLKAVPIVIIVVIILASAVYMAYTNVGTSLSKAIVEDTLLVGKVSRVDFENRINKDTNKYNGHSFTWVDDEMIMFTDENYMDISSLKSFGYFVSESGSDNIKITFLLEELKFENRDDYEAAYDDLLKTFSRRFGKYDDSEEDVSWKNKDIRISISKGTKSISVLVIDLESISP